MVTLPPFGAACVRVRPARDDGAVGYSLRVRKVFKRRNCVWLLVGLAVFFSAAGLAESVAFHYASVVGMGTLFAAVVAAWFVLKRLRPSSASARVFVCSFFSALFRPRLQRASPPRLNTAFSQTVAARPR